MTDASYARCSIGCTVLLNISVLLKKGKTGLDDFGQGNGWFWLGYSIPFYLPKIIQGIKQKVSTQVIQQSRDQFKAGAS